jgi:hypothetical protein
MGEENLDRALKMANIWFQTNTCTTENIDSFVANFRQGLGLNDEEQKIIKKRIYENHTIHMLDELSVLEDSGDHEKWINIAQRQGLKREIDWHYWGHYKDYISEKGYSKDVIDNLDEVTTRILGSLEDPKRTGNWDRRGLVMGSVQSGKTANYTGLIAKAIDSGYKMIVILTGVHNSLRSQTQQRINEELLGYDTQKAIKMEDIEYRRFGVGKYPSHRKKGFIQTLTTSSEKGDFSRSSAESTGMYDDSKPYILVIKKHVSILKNLNEWIKTHAGERDSEGRMRVSKIPLLLIDDECDQASVNTKKKVFDPDTGIIDEECDPTTTNRRIRQLLTTFDQSAYIGYTATPYANIFIHSDDKHPKYGEDLFPKNFIYNLPAPENYCGPGKIFGIKEGMNGPLPIVGDPIDDSEEIFPPGHKKDLDVSELPKSLMKAVKYYLLATAARRIRKTKNVHSSMLIHVTRFTNVQNKIHLLVSDEVRRLRGRIGAGESLKEFREIWENDYTSVSKEMVTEGAETHNWEDIRASLIKIIPKIEVKAINGSSKEALQYNEAEELSKKKEKESGEKLAWEERGIHVIAVGGNKLSRGLTLEGLHTTYYLRPSGMYDTLMQMGRWFGYRQNYLDLCRIYTLEEVINCFQQIATAEIDLRDQFKQMALLKLEPRDFGLSVQEDPGMLMITNAGKRRDTDVIEENYAGRITQTTNFEIDKTTLSQNKRVIQNLITNCNEEKEHKLTKGNFHWKGISKKTIIDFLTTYKGKGDTSNCNGNNISKFINKQEYEDLSEWDVILINKDNSKFTTEPIDGFRMGKVNRKANKAIKKPDLSIGVISSRTDEWLDFTEDEQASCLKKYIEMNEAEGIKMTEEDKKDIPPGAHIRWFRPRNRALMLIYSICGTNKDREYGLNNEEDIYGFVISFPSDTNHRRFKRSRVRVNHVYLKQYDTT